MDWLVSNGVLVGVWIFAVLLGMMLLDFPGTRGVERWLISRPTVYGLINRLRRRYGKLLFHLACSCGHRPEQSLEERRLR